MDALLITGDEDVLHEGSAGEANVKEYAVLGKHVVVFVLCTGTQRARLRRVGETLWIMPVYGPSRLFAAVRALYVARRELYFQRKLQVDLIDACDPFESALAAWLIALRFNRPLHIYTPLYSGAHYARTSAASYIFKLLSRFLIRKADSISTDSEHLRASLVRELPGGESRTFVVPRFVNIVAQKQSPAVDVREKYPQFKIILLSVRPLEREYNPELAIHVLAGVLRMYKFAGLIFVGEGSLKRSLGTLAQKLGVKEHVIFEPWEVDLTSYYKAAHIFLETSHEEEYGNSMLEAAAASCTVVSTNIGFAAAFIKNGENGYICGAHDTSCFVKTIISLINHPEVRESIRLNGMLTTESFMGKTERKSHIETVRKAWEAAIAHFQSHTTHAASQQIHIYPQDEGRSK
ncbi:MAG TPA: glycosyltransferase family 4 protein [Candidatus Paceibacterota bacterium]